ncbi:Glutaredoxin [Dillenia turbinata]|uniref:Glutaredoxin n=1 Tax=Dillenia turbinata TaxID=194707 RepID=A0AAN8VI86_9MAGN
MEIANDTQEKIHRLISSNAVVVFSMNSCCMCHVAKHLLFSLAVSPTIVELDQDEKFSGLDIQSLLFQLAGDGQFPIPAIFVGGKFLGSIEALISSHINGTLIPRLREAGALWL